MKGPVATAALAALLVALAPGAHAQCLPQERLVAPAPSATDQLGFAVAVSGDRILAGAPGQTAGMPMTGGAAYVFRLESSWTLEEELSPSQGQPGAQFGYAVALEGRRALVGSPSEEQLGMQPGAAYVFERTAGGWVERVRLFASIPTPTMGFGDAVALAGDLAVIGAPRDDTASFDAGAVYVFERNGAAWLETFQAVPADLQPQDLFGISIGLDGDRMLVGAPQQDVGGASNAGAAYVLERSGSTWSVAAKLLAPGGMDDRFGQCVALDGDRALVGAPGEAGAGAAHVFELEPGGWVERAVLLDPAGSAGDRFGESVALDGARALVGAPETDEGGESNVGRALLFRFASGAWSLERTYRSNDQVEEDRFGFAVAVSGPTAAVGERFDDQARGDAGSVHALSVPELVASTCACASGAPCANPDPGAGCANSAPPVGSGARLTSCGTTSVALDELVLTAAGLPPSQPGLVFVGEGLAAPFLQGDGLRCVTSATGGPWRYPVRSADVDGVLFEGPGLVAHGRASFPPAAWIDPGETWHFQGWYRDPAGPCGQGFNLTDALSVSFVP